MCCKLPFRNNKLLSSFLSVRDQQCRIVSLPRAAQHCGSCRVKENLALNGGTSSYKASAFMTDTPDLGKLQSEHTVMKVTITAEATVR